MNTATRDARFDDVDQAIAHEDAARAESRAARFSITGRLGGVPRLLRCIGASVLVVAAFTFMLQSGEQGDDVARYFHFLGFTATLGVAGFFCGLRIRDEKGARTFLGLSAAAVPVHFTVLGAMLYSQFAWLSGFPDYPAHAQFSAPDQAVALAVTAFGIAALVPVCWTAFLAFARPVARPLTAAYLLANATLLIPTRHPDVIGLVALGLLAGVVVYDRFSLSGVQALRTAEGRFVRALMTVPFAILIARTVHLYDPSALFWAAVFASPAVGLFSVVPIATRPRAWSVAAQYVSLLPTAVSWLCVSQALSLRVGVDAWILPIACLPLAGIYGVMSLHMIDGGAPVRRLAALVATGGMAYQLLVFPGVLSSVGCLATAIVATTYGYAAEQRGVFLMGLCALGFGLLYHLRYAADLYALSPWGSLAVLGIATVLTASLLERHHGALSHRLFELRSRMEKWHA
jgi:hypothetical protein